ncbi:NADP-dependent oxidoreductase [Microbacterium flavum]|uniref:NADP-dependent oxidoreductase n=1 Tax=Microbacterium flavum TaxID=415216 RepID=A0ABS5XXI2_9MICO|nr:NADP-dependent oxidoreductase [Microbacterium flavum]MBT8798651.1 NADP-dependent oxidoreductase [Microbacterium flavum]
MKAIRFHETGDADVLRYEDVAQPTPAAGEVRIVVAASAYNPADGGMRGGFLPIPLTLPHVPGYDVSGTVDALGEGVENVRIGDPVIGFLPMTGDGGAAQYVVAPADSFVAAPRSIPLEDAAGIPSVALTAAQALFEAGGLTSGQRLLVNGAGGPVGGYAVQLARRAGAHVIATASPRSADTVAANGADEIIDHTTTPVLDAVTAPVDMLLNLAPISPEDFAALATLVRDGGIVVSTTPMVETPSDDARGVRAATVYVHPDAARLADIVRLVDEDGLRVDIAAHVELRDLPALHAKADAGEVHGKVVIVPPAA